MSDSTDGCLDTSGPLRRGWTTSRDFRSDYARSSLACLKSPLCTLRASRGNRLTTSGKISIYKCLHRSRGVAAPRNGFTELATRYPPGQKTTDKHNRFKGLDNGYLLHRAAGTNVNVLSSGRISRWG